MKTVDVLTAARNFLSKNGSDLNAAERRSVRYLAKVMSWGTGDTRDDFKIISDFIRHQPVDVILAAYDRAIKNAKRRHIYGD